VPQAMGGSHAKTQKSKEDRKESAAVLAWRNTYRDLTRFSHCGMTCVARLVHVATVCGTRLLHVATRILGPILLSVAFGLIGLVTHTCLFYALPLLEREGLAMRISLVTTGMFLLFNIVYNYAKAAFMDPGLPPEYETGMAELRSHVEELGEAQMKQCKKCDRLKPPRTHHCSICNRCVLKMDHHCPWINNCVGWRNYRFFSLFMLYLLLGCCFVVVCCLIFFMDIVTFRKRGSFGSRWLRMRILMAFGVCSAIAMSLLLLGGFHVYLVLSNETTIEFLTNFLHRADAMRNGGSFRNPYDLGWTPNFQQVFGPYQPRNLRWLLSWLAQPPSGDGICFQSHSRLSA